MRKWIAFGAGLLVLGLIVLPAAYSQETGTPPAAAPETAAPALSAGYDKGFFIRSADGAFELKLGARVHTLYSFNSKDNGPGADRGLESNFAISTARVNLKGGALLPGLTYVFEADFAKGSVKLLDFYADYAFAPKTFHLRAGMWKRPFSRPFITSSGRYEMVERTVASSYFGEGYDVGAAFHNGYEKSPAFEWVVGVFNGVAADKPWFEGSGGADAEGVVTITKGAFTNVPKKFHPALVARAGYNHGGIEGYSEADLEGGPLRLGVAANVMVDFDVDEDEVSTVRAGLDWTLKVQGLSFTGAVYLGMAQKTDAGGGADTGFFDQEYAAVGAYAQLGYLMAGKIQPLVRYSLVSPDGTRTAQEIAAGASLYLSKHNFKWQLLYAALVNPGGLSGRNHAGEDRLDHQVRTHLVFSF